MWINQGLHSEVTSERYSNTSKTSQLEIHGKFLKKYMTSSSKLKTLHSGDWEPYETSKIELLENIVNGFQPLIIFVKTSLFDFLQGLWIYPHFKYNFFPMNFQWPFQWLLPFSDLSYIVVTEKRIQNAFFKAYF